MEGAAQKAKLPCKHLNYAVQRNPFNWHAKVAYIFGCTSNQRLLLSCHCFCPLLSAFPSHPQTWPTPVNFPFTPTDLAHTSQLSLHTHRSGPLLSAFPSHPQTWPTLVNFPFTPTDLAHICQLSLHTHSPHLSTFPSHPQTWFTPVSFPFTPTDLAHTYQLSLHTHRPGPHLSTFPSHPQTWPTPVNFPFHPQIWFTPVSFPFTPTDLAHTCQLSLHTHRPGPHLSTFPSTHRSGSHLSAFPSHPQTWPTPVNFPFHPQTWPTPVNFPFHPQIWPTPVNFPFTPTDLAHTCQLSLHTHRPGPHLSTFPSHPQPPVQDPFRQPPTETRRTLPGTSAVSHLSGWERENGSCGWKTGVERHGKTSSWFQPQGLPLSFFFIIIVQMRVVIIIVGGQGGGRARLRGWGGRWAWLAVPEALHLWSKTASTSVSINRRTKQYSFHSGAKQEKRCLNDSHTDWGNLRSVLTTLNRDIHHNCSIHDNRNVREMSTPTQLVSQTA